MQVEHDALDVQVASVQRTLSPAELARVQALVEASVKACAVPTCLAFVFIRVLQRTTFTDQLVLATAEFLLDIRADLFE